MIDVHCTALVYEGVEPLHPEAVAEAVIWAVAQPPHVKYKPD